MHPTTATQATPEIRFTPFLDDQSLPDFAANHNTNRRLGAFNTGLHGPAGDLHTPSKLLTPEGLLDQFTSVVTPLHKTNSIKHVGPMFNGTWMPFLTALSGAAQDASSIELVRLCMEGQKLAIKIACLFDLEDPRQAFVASLSTTAMF